MIPAAGFYTLVLAASLYEANASVYLCNSAFRNLRKPRNNHSSSIRNTRLVIFAESIFSVREVL